MEDLEQLVKRYGATPILRTEVGSTVHGIEVGDDDLDFMGVAIEPRPAIFGLQDFEQVVYRTAGEGQRSLPGDVDYTCYGLKKYLRLALENNPSVILPLLAPSRFVHHETERGRELRSLAPAIVSLRCKDRFLGYMRSQQKRALEGRGPHARKEKWASHMVRLGHQGLEIVSTGRLTLPMPAEEAAFIRAVKRGEISIAEALFKADELEHAIDLVSSPLPAEPDVGLVEKWMDFCYARTYDAGYPTTSWRSVRGYYTKRREET